MSGRPALHLCVTEMFPGRREFSKTFDPALISAEKLTGSKMPPRSGCNMSEDSLQIKCFSERAKIQTFCHMAGLVKNNKKKTLRSDRT